MEKQLLKARLNIEPATWGSNDTRKREQIRKLLKDSIPDFDEKYVENLIKNHDEISVTLNCYLVDPPKKDIDNLAKIPIDAIFFSARNETGYESWESKITSLSVRKIRSNENTLEIIISGITN